MSFIPFTSRAFFPVVIYDNMLVKAEGGINHISGNQDMQITDLKSFSVYSFDLVPETYNYFTFAVFSLSCSGS